MKKKLLLITLLVALLACAFAISVSAEEASIPEWPTTVETLEGMSDKSVFGADGTVGATSRVLMSDGKAYPAYYIFKNSATFGITFTELSGYSASDIVRLEVPNGIVTAGTTCITTSGGYTAVKTIVLPNTVTTIGAGAFKLSTLVSINLPDSLVSMANNVFYGCTSLKSIAIPPQLEKIEQTTFLGCTALETVDFSRATSLKTIAYKAFYQTTSLENAILPEGLTTLEDICFKYSGVKEVYLPSTLETVGTDNVFGECSRLETIRSKATNISDKMFYNASALKNLYLENTVTIGNSAFYKASSLTSLTLPNTLTQIDTNAFAYAAFDKIIVPASVTTLGDGTFKQNTALTTAVVLGSTMGSNMFLNCSNMTKLVITENFTTFGSSAINGVNRNSFTTFYTGKTNDFDTIKTIITLDRVSSAKPSSYTDYKNGTHTQNKYIFIYGANICEVGFDDTHDVQVTEGNTCCGICTRCGLLEMLENPVHVSYNEVRYGGSTTIDYLKEIVIVSVCENCKKEVGENVLGTMFEENGYSAQEDDGYGIVRKFMFDNDAIAKYIELVDSDFEYGMVVAIANNSPLQIGEDGKTEPANTGVVSANFTNGNYTNLQVKIANITEEAKGISIVNTLYVRVDNEFYYANGETMAKTAEGKSYNDFNPQA